MSSGEVAKVNLKKLKPYGDIMDDGTVQLCFTLPVEPSPEAQNTCAAPLDQRGRCSISQTR